MQVGGELGELRPCALFLTLLLFSSDLSVVIVKVATNLLILGLHVLQVLLASIEIVLPSSAVVSTVEFLDYSCHLCVVGHLASLIPTLIHSIDS